MRLHVFYRTVKVDGLSLFYREAGPKDAPAILLLHGLPSSSRMYEPLLSRLADRYHLVAPDYPGFGHTHWPGPRHFAYTFDRCAKIMNGFTEAIALPRYTLYMQDDGGPVGFRMALSHPERINAFIVQMPWHTMKAWGPFGRRDGLFGPIVQPTKSSYAQICCRWQQRGRATWARTPMW